MIFCRSIRECRRGPKRYRVSRLRKETCHKKMLPHERRCGSSKSVSSKMRSVSFVSRTKSRRMKEQNRKRKRWQSSWALWERNKRCIISSFCLGWSTECLRLRHPLSKCQEKKKESRGIQRPGGAVKALQRLLVLILLGFQMQRLKAEPQETSKYQDFEKIAV